MNKIASLILNYNQACTFPTRAHGISTCSILFIYITDKVSVSLNTGRQKVKLLSSPKPILLLLAGGKKIHARQNVRKKFIEGKMQRKNSCTR